MRTFRIELELTGRRLTLPVMEEMVDHVVSLLPDRRVARLMFQDDPGYSKQELDEVMLARDARREAIRSAFATHAGKKVTKDILENICIVLSGWWDEAALGIQRPDWQNSKPAWASLYLYDLERVPCKGRMFRVRIRSYAGPSAGCKWGLVLPGGALQRLIRDAGCRKYEEYKDEDAAGLWFTARVSFREGRMRFLDVCCSSSQERLNKDLQQRRQEKCIGPFPALKGKGKCQICPISLHDCSNARTDVSYSEIRECRCGRKGYFRPLSESRGWCLNCLVTGRYRHVTKNNKTERGNPA